MWMLSELEFVIKLGSGLKNNAGLSSQKTHQRKRDNEKVAANSAEFNRKKLSSINEPRFLLLTRQLGFLAFRR